MPSVPRTNVRRCLGLSCARRLTRRAVEGTGVWKGVVKAERVKVRLARARRLAQSVGFKEGSASCHHMLLGAAVWRFFA